MYKEDGLLFNLFFLNDLRDGYSFSEVGGEQADEMTENQRKNILEVW